MKVAVASTDGKFVNQHFGRAKDFLIFQWKDGFFFFLEKRDNTPPCLQQDEHDDMLVRSVQLLHDCQAVIVSQIGPGAVEALELEGITPYVIPNFIEEALAELKKRYEKND